MGEIAEGLLNGDFDSITGEYLGEGYGYPRTMVRQHKTGSYSEKTCHRIVSDERLVGATNRFIQDGYQILFKGQKFTFFPKNCKLTHKGHWYTHNKGQEVEKILELTGYYKQIITPVENNVQKCIDHILAKADKIGIAKGADHATANMLKTVAKELEAFL